MDRKIKFRAWDSKNKYMLDSSYGNWISFDGEMYEDASRKYNTPNIEIEKSKGLVLMQFTDNAYKDGTDAYEGDIFRRVSTLDTFLVEWNKNGFYAHQIWDEWRNKNVFKENRLTSISSWDTYNTELIGNICENPELLND